MNVSSQALSALASASFFSRALAAFERATAICGARERCFAAAGSEVRLLLAGDRLEAPLTASLAHLARTAAACPPRPGAPCLTIRAWDDASTNTVFADRPWRGHESGGAREILLHESGPLRVLSNPMTGVLSALDAASGEAIWWIASAEAVPLAERAAPFRTILQWWAADHGCLLVHAAAVGRGAAGVLLAGSERAGKSTTAWLCLRHGLRFAGDDYVAITESPPDRIHGLYSSLKLDLRRAAALGAPGGAAEPAGPADEKSVFYLAESHADRLAADLDLRAVLLPRITGGAATTIRRASAAEGLRTLAPTTLYLQPGGRAVAFAVLAGLLRRVPCYVLELGEELDAIAPEIQRFLEALS